MDDNKAHSTPYANEATRSNISSGTAMFLPTENKNTEEAHTSSKCDQRKHGLNSEKDKNMFQRHH